MGREKNEERKQKPEERKEKTGTKSERGEVRLVNGERKEEGKSYSSVSRFLPVLEDAKRRTPNAWVAIEQQLA